VRGQVPYMDPAPEKVGGHLTLGPCGSAAPACYRGPAMSVISMAINTRVDKKHYEMSYMYCPLIVVIFIFTHTHKYPYAVVLSVYHNVT